MNHGVMVRAFLVGYKRILSVDCTAVGSIRPQGSIRKIKLKSSVFGSVPKRVVWERYNETVPRIEMDNPAVENQPIAVEHRARAKLNCTSGSKIRHKQQ